MNVDDIVNDITLHMANDGSADYIQLTEQLYLIERVSEIILGFLIVIILLGIPVVVSIEVMYINFPVFQTTVEKMMLKTTGKLNKALGLIIRDARKALKLANTIETGKSANLIYLRLKCVAIIIAIVSAGLVLGVGPTIVNFILKIANSLIEGFRLVM